MAKFSLIIQDVIPTNGVDNAEVRLVRKDEDQTPPVGAPIYPNGPTSAEVVTVGIERMFNHPIMLNLVQIFCDDHMRQIPGAQQPVPAVEPTEATEATEAPQDPLEGADIISGGRIETD